MKRVVPFALLLSLALGVLAAPIQAVAPPARPDLTGFRTVETAITTRIAAAAPAVPVAKAVQPAFLGVNLEAKNGKYAIAQVAPGSPAEKAGLQPGDVLSDVAGAEALAQLVRARAPGEALKLSLVRNGKPVEVSVTLAAVSRPMTPGAGRGKGGKGAKGGWGGGMRIFTKPAYRLAVVAIEYPDVKHNDKIKTSDWERSLYSKGTYTDKSATGQKVYGSLNDYYIEQSLGALHVEGKVFDWVTVKGKRTSYGGDNKARTALLTEALDVLLARDGKDALKGFDGIFFLYAGDRVKTERGGLYWPHRSTVRYKGEGWAYFICPELTGARNMASISVIAHEFGHMLGMPDLYAATERPGVKGLGVWCTMAVGHGNDGKPLHFSAWCKERMGWIKPVVIDPRDKQKLILEPIWGTSKQCYKVLIRLDGSEYLLLENRVRKGFERDLPAEGLLIWRVVNNRPVLEESHGFATPQGPSARFFPESVPYPSAANNAFTPLTTPSSKSRTEGGLPVHITNIQKLPDGRITFFIGYEYL